MKVIRATETAKATGKSKASINPERLAFSEPTATRLASIARCERISNSTHVKNLPASWGTLYELSTLTESQWACTGGAA